MSEERYFLYEVDTTRIARMEKPVHKVVFRVRDGKLEIALNPQVIEGRPTLHELTEEQYEQLRSSLP